jgi:hypothetical protein
MFQLTRADGRELNVPVVRALSIAVLAAALALGAACTDESNGNSESGFRRPPEEDHDRPLATQYTNNSNHPEREAFISDARVQLGYLEIRIGEIETSVDDQGDQVQPDAEIRLTQLKGSVESVQTNLVLVQTLDESDYGSVKSDIQTKLHAAMTEAEALAGELSIGNESRATGAEAGTHSP